MTEVYDVVIDNRNIKPGETFRLKARIKAWKSITISKGSLEIDVEINES